MAIVIEKVGRRSYLVGDTYPVRDRIKAAGGHWDADKRAWWVSSSEKALSLVDSQLEAPRDACSSSPTHSTDSLTDDSKISGKATYKGKPYLLVWEGTTSRGQAGKLAFTDGSKVFWATAGEYQVTKRYEAREYRGHSESMTLGTLKRLRAKFARARANGNEDGIANGQRYECPECGDYVTRGQGNCWETGSAH